ncbi:hypothetical protein SUDANB105_04782 [Streptomyces sp. enrichment culture]
MPGAELGPGQSLGTPDADTATGEGTHEGTQGTHEGTHERGQGATVVYTRKDVSTLTATERRRFIKALQELKRRGEYDEFVRTHLEYYVADGENGLRTAHMAPSFLPWHRQFLLELEKALRRSTRRCPCRTGTGPATAPRPPCRGPRACLAATDAPPAGR